MGPNLNAVLGRAVASTGFAYSDALKAKGGKGLRLDERVAPQPQEVCRRQQDELRGPA
nr:hypothetical protein [Novosphingobium sp.]